MHAVVRSYSGGGAKELFELLDQRKTEVEETMRTVAGFVSYTLFRTADGGVTVTVCDNKSGTDESLNVAKGWISEHAANLGASPPTVTEGPVVIHAG